MFIFAAILFPPTTCLFSCKLFCVSLSVFVCVSYYMHSSLAVSAVFLVYPLMNPTKLYLFFFFFGCGPFLMVFVEFVTILFLFYVLVFWPQGMWDLSSLTRDRTHTSCIGRQTLNHWATREVRKLEDS